jgi:uncharacterized protein DUF559
VLPAELQGRVFTLKEAQRAGLSRSTLRGRRWQRIGPGVYAERGVARDPLAQIAGALARLPAKAAGAASWATAGFLHGLDLPPCSPIHLTIANGVGVTARAGVILHRVDLDSSEVVEISGVAATSAVRTLVDLGRQRSLVESVIALDMGLHDGLATKAALTAWVGSHARFPGAARLREAIELAEPLTESPGETRLRLVLVKGGLPRPLAQVSLTGPDGVFLGRADLYYPERRLVIEYDGAGHRKTLAADDRRQNRLVEAGYTVLRFTAADLASPDAVVALVRAALAGRMRAIGGVSRG